MNKIVTIVVAMIISGVVITPPPLKANSYKKPILTFMPFPIDGSSSEAFQGFDTLTTNAYGPFSVGSDNFDATFTYSMRGVNGTVIERMRLLMADTSTPVSTSTKGQFLYSSGTFKTVTFTIPLRDYFTSKGLTLNFEIIDSKDFHIIRGYSATFYPRARINVSTNVLRSGVYQSKNIGFMGDGSSLIGLNEKYDFTRIGNYLVADYYYRLPLNEISFDYYSMFPFTYESAKLCIVDENLLFPYLEHNDDNVVVIPLNLTQNGNKITISLKNRLYVNKKTLQISDTYMANYVQTTSLYLPINGRKKFNGSHLYIDFINLGYNQLTASFGMTYDADKAIVGLCSDAEHCVNGGIKG